jgi:hypothetical protein
LHVSGEFLVGAELQDSNVELDDEDEAEDLVCREEVGARDDNIVFVHEERVGQLTESSEQDNEED